MEALALALSLVATLAACGAVAFSLARARTGEAHAAAPAPPQFLPTPTLLPSTPPPPAPRADAPGLTEADVARVVAAAIDAYRAGADHERMLATALLEQMAHEVLTRSPYDAGQRRLAVEQRLRRAYNRLGASPPADLLETVRRMS